RKKIEDDIKNSKQYFQNNPNLKLYQPQPMKASFKSNIRKSSISQQKPTIINLPNIQGLPQNENKHRETTIYSQKTIKSQEQPEDYKNMPNQEEYIPQVQGPQIEMDQYDVSFIINTGLVAFDSVQVRNIGTASIYYEWKRIENEKQHSVSLQDPEQKFFCHHEQNVIKPGQQKKFIFSFMSKLTGTFYEEWEFKCEPPNQNQVKNLKLSGHSIDVDNLKNWRGNFDENNYKQFLYKSMGEVIEDILGNVRTPTPPLPDLKNEEVRRIEFEAKNEYYNLFYNDLVMKWWFQLENDIYEKLKLNKQEQYWDLNVDYIRRIIEKVEDEDDRAFFMKRFNNYFELNRKKPIERSEIYPLVREKMNNIINNIAVFSDKSREELQMWDFIFRIPQENQSFFSEDELKKHEEENQKLKQDWMKKTKKKKWTDEDEKKQTKIIKMPFMEKFKMKFILFGTPLRKKSCF
ncbi:mycbp associated protein, putative, partial [Ichthyophthirius multifiliis]